jgi:aldehyde:ferredoxin oxidoreductase
MKGFIGKLLRVDLTSGEISEEPINNTIAEKFLGGAGYCSRYLYDKLEESTDPLSSENILMFMTGPFCGSSVPTSGRFVVCSKSPYTGLWGESNCGGFFGPELKKAGYDGIIIEGKSEKPVILNIVDNKASLEDATSLWGKGILETSEILKEKSESKTARVACIGQAGENLVKYAIIGSEEKAAGRTGMGAVMGSKKLKAIVVKGSKRSFESADPEKFKSAVKEMIENVNSAFSTQMMGMLGTAGGVDKFNLEGELPIKYWTKGTWEGAYNISGATASEQIFTKNYPCYACPIGCAKKAKVKEGKYETEGEVEAPEYETIAGFGSMLLNENLNAIVEANELCNDFGIDTISASSTIALIYHLYNEGKIKSEDIDGLEPDWGTIEPAIEMVKKIAFKQGIGKLLAEGSDAVGKQFSISQQEIATALGMEIPYHDLRHTFGMALTYSVGTPRGPCHNACDMYMALLGLPFEEIGIQMIDRQSDDEDMAKNCARLYDYRSLYSSLILCVFCNPKPSLVSNVIETGLGIDCSVNKIKTISERIYVMKRLMNLKLGLEPEDEKLPDILLKPLEEGGSAGKSPNFDKLKKLYYEVRDWDLETGKPSKATLQELGLNNL